MTFSVHNYGIDSSGRAILMTAYMHDWWESVVAELGFRPTIIQGAFLSRVPGGGAANSSGYHDLGGCLDLRTRDLTKPQIDALIRVTRDRGAGSWRRDPSAAHGGMDAHCHLTLGSDRPLSSGAQVSWNSYLSGGDGIAGPGRDYEARPTPLVLNPPEDKLNADDKAWIQARLDAQRSSIVADLLAAVVDGASFTVRHALERIGKAFDRNGKPK